MSERFSCPAFGKRAVVAFGKYIRISGYEYWLRALEMFGLGSGYTGWVVQASHWVVSIVLYLRVLRGLLRAVGSCFESFVSGCIHK